MTQEQQTDLIDKVECLIGYLKVWANNGQKPLELESVIKEAEEWITANEVQGNN